MNCFILVWKLYPKLCDNKKQYGSCVCAFKTTYLNNIRDQSTLTLIIAMAVRKGEGDNLSLDLDMKSFLTYIRQTMVVLALCCMLYIIYIL